MAIGRCNSFMRNILPHDSCLRKQNEQSYMNEWLSKENYSIFDLLTLGGGVMIRWHLQNDGRDETWQ